VLLLLLDDIKIINFLHVNFFGDSTYYFYWNITYNFLKKEALKIL